jgi:predicted lysophospholipase L1 biosynthesis ABC-type transport system permease subunit
MKKFNLFQIYLFMLIAFTMSSCELIADIFRGGVIVGLVIAGLVVGLILWIIGGTRK